MRKALNLSGFLFAHDLTLNDDLDTIDMRPPRGGVR